MTKNIRTKKNKIANGFFFICCSSIIIFYIVLFHGRTFASLNWAKAMAQRSCISKRSRISKITGNEITFYFVTYIYTYNDNKFEGNFWTKSKLFDSDINYFAIRVNPEKPDESLFKKPPWIRIIVFFILAFSLLVIGIFNITGKEKE